MRSLLLGAALVLGAASAQSTKYAQDARNVVRYEVISSCPTNVTYALDGMSIQQEQGIKSGWTKTWKATGSLVLTSINAQLTCKGKVTINIYRGGKRIATATSSGEYAMAQASK